MKGKMYIIAFTLILFVTAAMPKAFAKELDKITDPVLQGTTEPVNLTDSQKNELKQLFDKKIELEKQIIKKYQDFGVLTKEQADVKIMHMDKIKLHLEKNGYMPKFHKNHGKGWKEKGEN